MSFVSVNFQVTDQLSVYDRAVAFGDGVFTTGRIEDGRLLMRQAHLDRLKQSTAYLHIDGVDWTRLATSLDHYANKQQTGVLKVIISAGKSQRGYARNAVCEPTVIMQTSAYPSHYLNWQCEGVRVAVAKTQLGINPLLAKIKHLNRLEQVFIRQELDKLDVDELLVTNIDGDVVECASGNVFWLVNGHWQTPCLHNSGVAGLVRERLIGKLDAEVVRVTPAHLANIDAMFVCNSVLGIAPVATLNKRDLALQSALCKKLNHWLKE